MAGTTTRSDDRERTDLPSDELFDVFSSRIRRTMLFHLRQHGAATLDELVDVLATVGESGAESVDRDVVRTQLVHVHLPKLAETDLVSYDPERRVVESEDLHDEVGEWLDLAVRREIQFAGAPESPDESQGAETIRVLLADDEPGLAETIALYIEREHDDIDVTTATSALEAVTTLEEESFDCIVSDYQMPAISGLDFLNAVRQRDVAIPFIVYTAKGSEEVASRAIATGVTDYVQKRTDTAHYDELADRIRSVVQQE